MTTTALPLVKPGQLYTKLPDGRWEIYLDATMARVFGACPQMFKYSFVDSIIPKGTTAFSRDLGSWWSLLMEHIYVAEFRKTPLTSEEIITLSMKLWVDMKLDDLEINHPKMFKEFGGRAGALQMIAEYAHRQLPIDRHTWLILAAEASFGRNKEVCIGETERIVLYWLGQPDLYVITDGRIVPVDHKSTGWIDRNTQSKYKPDIQIPGYIIAGQILAKSLNLDYPIDRAIINCVARTDRTDKTTKDQRPRFKRIFISYTDSELDEWRKHRLVEAEQLRTCFETGVWTWHTHICNNFYMRICPFKNIDAKPPEIRPTVISADYLKRDPWIPGKTKEEMMNGKETE